MTSGAAAAVTAATAAGLARSHAAMLTPAPAPARVAQRAGTPDAAGPDLETRTHRFARPLVTRCLAVKAPRVPVPPVTSTVPAGRAAAGTVSTIFPWYREADIYRNASGACRTSHAVTGGSARAPVASSPVISARIWPSRARPTWP